MNKDKALFRLEREKLLLTGEIPRLFMKYALPGVAGLLFLGIQSVIDGIVLGRFVGANALASVNLVLPCYSLISAFAIVMGIGGQTLVSISLGRGDKQEANNALRSVFVFLLGMSVVVSLVIFLSAGKIASIIGRYYAMDRDKRWERVKEAYDLLVKGEGKKAADMVQAMQESYDEGVTDEFIKPIVNANFDGTIKEGDVVIFFNYRNDRAKELTVVLTQQDMPEVGMRTIPGLQYYCMTPYDASFKGVHILFDKENVSNTLGEYLAAKGLNQLHIAETEKYAHVTFFFNGGRETPYDNEDRILVPSPKVATYDLKPEMSAYEVKDKLVAAINENKYDFIVVNFANGDMVGHTGIYEAIEKAVVAVDACVKDVIEAAKAQDYEAIIIADHGNADHALNEDGTPNTAHSLNPVPCVYVTENKAAKVEDGRLADVAPTILKIMGLEAPAEMNGNVLIK